MKKTDNGGGKNSIKKAQAVAHDPNHDPLWRVNTLPSKLYEQTYEMLKRHSPRTVAELLQEEGYHTDIKAITLAHILERFRSDRIPRHQLLNVYVVERLTSEAKKQINVFTELSDLLGVNSMRIRKALLAEEETGVLSAEVNKQLHLQSRLLKIYGDMGIKSGMMSHFIQSFMRETQQIDDMMTRETRDMFLRFFLYKQQGGVLDAVLDDLTNMPDDPLLQ